MCNDIIDRICSKIHSCECLNALHAIRDGHPLGIDNPYKYRNAYAMVCQQSYFNSPSHSDMRWLKGMSYNEGLT